MNHIHHQTGQAGKLILLTLLGVLALKAVTQVQAGELPLPANADAEQIATE